MKPRVLVITDYYTPARKAGGLVTALSNLLLLLCDHFEFHLVTRNRDLGDSPPLPGIKSDSWSKREEAQAFYTSDLGFYRLWRIVKITKPNVIYLNSYFSILTARILTMRRIGALPCLPLVVAPRGEFSPGALKLKPKRKYLVRKLFRALGFNQDLIWHACSELEVEDIRSSGVARANEAAQLQIVLANDPPSREMLDPPRNHSRGAKVAGKARFIFYSRVSRKKNLLHAIWLLSQSPGSIQLSIVGPIEDAAYWQECQSQIRSLPPGIDIRYEGQAAPDEALAVLRQYHFLILPTLGENFGYVILEAMAAGCPVLISDTTPWRGLEELEVGWDLPLGDESGWLRALRHCIEMGQHEFERRALRAQEYVTNWGNSTPYLDRSLTLFHQRQPTAKTMAG